MSEPHEPLIVFVGFDTREEDAFLVCRHMILRQTPAPVTVTPLVQDELRARGLYTRPADEPASTQFAFTRFLVPRLRDYQGWALSCDCDFLFTRSLRELFACCDPASAALCVPHNYTPQRTQKMDGQPQVAYPRKNWSSLVLWNCGHPANQTLTPDYVNTAPAADLHRFAWLADAQIGSLPDEWNWLEGESPPPARVPAGIHFTNGGPWFPACRYVTYAGRWKAARLEALAGPVCRPEDGRLNVALHTSRPEFGVTAAEHWQSVLALAGRERCTTVLDYGCGKGLLKQLVGHQLDVTEYDPGIPGKQDPPLPADLVVAIDVLEHVDPALVDNVIHHLRLLTRKVVYLSISTRPSSQTLADGRNAHLTVRPAAWWRQHLGRRFVVRHEAVRTGRRDVIYTATPRPG